MRWAPVLTAFIFGIAIVATLAPRVSIASESATIVLDSGQNNISTIPGTEYLHVKHTISAEEVSSADYENQWRPYNAREINRHDGDDIWLRFSARSIDTERQSWWLVLAWPLINHAQVFAYNHRTDNWWQSKPVGVAYPLSNRAINHRYLIFPRSFNPDETQTYYVNIKTKGLIATPLSFWRGDKFVWYGHVDLLIIGGLLGALIIMLFYNMGLAVFLKDSAYWYYCAYVVCVIFYQTASVGFIGFYVGLGSPMLVQFTVLFTSLACFVAATLFIRKFLRLHEYGGWLLWGNNFLIIIWSTIAFISLMASEALINFAFSVAAFFSCVIAVVTGAVLWQKKVPAAKMFVISWSLLIVGTVIFVMTLQGFFQFNTFTRYSQTVGFAAELALLSMALAYRINYEKKEKESAQSEALLLTKKVSTERRERLKAQMETLDIQRQLNEELEQHVSERTEQLNDAMTKLESANAELTKLSVTDSLTKVHNRRYFDDTLIDEYKRALRTGQPLGLIVVDIDYFKNVNDFYGHTVGDHCITLVAETLKRVINRPGDVVARYGGEEFVYLLPGSNEHDAEKVAENCRLAVQALQFRVKDDLVPLTVSAGVAAWVPTVEGAYKQLLNAADTALYRAKNAGRNCVKTASDRGKLASI